MTDQPLLSPELDEIEARLRRLGEHYIGVPMRACPDNVDGNMLLEAADTIRQLREQAASQRVAGLVEAKGIAEGLPVQRPDAFASICGHAEDIAAAIQARIDAT